MTTSGYHQHLPKQNRRNTQPSTYQSTFQQILPSAEVTDSFIHVDVTHTTSGIRILGPSDINSHAPPTYDHHTTTLRSLHQRLPKSLQRICGAIKFPPDGGKSLIQYLQRNNLPLIGASDASLKDGQSGQAWILTTGDINHISDPYMHLSGSGPVDGFYADLSSARGSRTDFFGHNDYKLIKQSE